jgi:hypothetical protein
LLAGRLGASDGLLQDNVEDHMTVEDMGREGLRLVSRLAGAAVAVPVVAGYVLFGAAVFFGRSLLDAVRLSRRPAWPLGGELPAAEILADRLGDEVLYLVTFRGADEPHTPPEPRGQPTAWSGSPVGRRPRNPHATVATADRPAAGVGL